MEPGRIRFRTKFPYISIATSLFKNTGNALSRPTSQPSQDWYSEMQHKVVRSISCAMLPARWLALRESCSKLFVGGLSYDTNERVLKDAFGQHGDIREVKVICDHVSGKSKGFGFVEFTAEDSASKALQEMDGQLLDGRNIRVDYANKGQS